jgi:hypothetical protein
MASYVKFTLEDGTDVYVESSDSPKGSGSLIPSRGAAETVEHATASFEKSVEAVRKMAATMINGFREGFEEKPTEVAISFGLKASADLGNLVVARTGVEANYNVSLRWQKDKKEETASGEAKE